MMERRKGEGEKGAGEKTNTEVEKRSRTEGGECLAGGVMDEEQRRGKGWGRKQGMREEERMVGG